MTVVPAGLVTPIEPADPGTPPMSAAAARRWVRRRRGSARVRISLDSLYVGVLTVLVVGAIFGPGLLRAVWPDEPATTGTAAVTTTAALTLLLVGLLAALRELGPVTIGRADVTWLLTQPVSRRGLLLPAYARVLVGAALAGAAVGLAGAGTLASRPIDGGRLVVSAVLGAALGVSLTAVAAWAQRNSWAARILTGGVLATVAACVAVLLDDRVAGAPWVAAIFRYAVPAGWFGLPASTLGALAGAAGPAAIAVAVLVGVTLGRLSAGRIRAAAETVGAYLDSAYAAEPGFASAAGQRRFWSGRALRTMPLRAAQRRPAWSGLALAPALPALTRADLRVLRRSGWRLAWPAGTALLPAVLADGPGLLIAAVLLVGALHAAGRTTDGIRMDTENPALLRLLGLTGRQAALARLVVPTVLGATWCALALGLLALLGPVPPGPWWALGLAVGPAAGVSAVHRARSGHVRNDLPLIETPAGAIAPGPIMWLLAGPDLLAMAALPALVAVTISVGLESVSWWWVLIQAGFSAVCVLVYLWLGTDRRRPR